MGQRPSPLTTAEMQEIDELLATGMSQKKIAAQVGRAQSTISLHCKRTGQTPVHRAPTEAIQRHIDLSIEKRLEHTAGLMGKVLEIAEQATSGREIRECSVAWGVLIDKLAVLEGRPSNISESRSGPRGPGTIDFAEVFRKLDDQIEAEATSGHPGPGREDGS
jgi:helix-turn-helix protein